MNNIYNNASIEDNQIVSGIFVYFEMYESDERLECCLHNFNFLNTTWHHRMILYCIVYFRMHGTIKVC